VSFAIFTTAPAEQKSFPIVGGSDCGIANVNLGTSGARSLEAFGGEKELAVDARQAGQRLESFVSCGADQHDQLDPGFYPVNRE